MENTAQYNRICRVGIISILQSEITTGGRFTERPPDLCLSAGVLGVIIKQKVTI